MTKQKKIKAVKKNKLGTKQFRDGVCFVLEEMFLSGYEDRDSAINLLKHCLAPYREEIFATMRKNNKARIRRRTINHPST